MTGQRVTPCRTCGKDVSKTAKSCPHCGESHPGIDLKARKKGCLGCLGVAGGFFLLLIIVSIFSEESKDASRPKEKIIPLSQQNLDLSKARSYEVVGGSDFSFPGRKRVEWLITSYATDFDGYAQTAMQAAINLQEQTRAHVAIVKLLPEAESGAILAYAGYAIDGRGFSGDQGWRWEVEAARRAPLASEIEIEALWNENRAAFLVGGVLDENMLRTHIAQQLGVSKDAVHLPWVDRYPYLNN